MNTLWWLDVRPLVIDGLRYRSQSSSPEVVSICVGWQAILAVLEATLSRVPTLKLMVPKIQDAILNRCIGSRAWLKACASEVPLSWRRKRR